MTRITTQPTVSRLPAPRRPLATTPRRAMRSVTLVTDEVDALGAHWDAMQRAMAETAWLRD